MEDIRETVSKFNVAETVKKLFEHSPGHLDQKGELKSEHVDEELRNKLSNVSTNIYLWRKKGATAEQVDNLGMSSIKTVLGMSEFKGKTDLVEDLVRHSNHLSSYADKIFGEKEHK